MRVRVLVEPVRFHERIDDDEPDAARRAPRDDRRLVGMLDACRPRRAGPCRGGACGPNAGTAGRGSPRARSPCCCSSAARRRLSSSSGSSRLSTQAGTEWCTRSPRMDAAGGERHRHAHARAPTSPPRPARPAPRRSGGSAACRRAIRAAGSPPHPAAARARRERREVPFGPALGRVGAPGARGRSGAHERVSQLIESKTGNG